MIVCTDEQLRHQRHLVTARGNVPLRLLLEELELRRCIDQHFDTYCPSCVSGQDCYKLMGMQYMLEDAKQFPDAEPIPLNRVLAKAI